MMAAGGHRETQLGLPAKGYVLTSPSLAIELIMYVLGTGSSNFFR